MKMGIVMKKLVLAAAVLAVTASSALAADMAVKAKAPPPAPFEPWDLAFGSAIMNDYIFRGVTQSNHKPSVAVYFEPRYNVTKDLQLYRSEEHTSELQSRRDLVCRLLLEKKNIK